MHGMGFNAELIRVVLIVLVLMITLLLRARKMPRNSKPVPGSDAGKESRPGDSPRPAPHQFSWEARAPRSDQPLSPDRFRVSEPLRQPSKIEPESSFVPSFLLLALVACLCVVAYRYWAR